MPFPYFCAWLFLLLAPVVRVDSQDQQFAEDLLYYAPGGSLEQRFDRPGLSVDPQPQDEDDDDFHRNPENAYPEDNLQNEDMGDDRDVKEGEYSLGTSVHGLRAVTGDGGSFSPFGKRSSLGKRLKSLNQNVREHYMRMFAPNKPNLVGTKDLKRERHIGGTTLSVESPMDLIRQRLLQELHRRELMQKQRQIQTNNELLSSIGKRNMKVALSPVDRSSLEFSH